VCRHKADSALLIKVERAEIGLTEPRRVSEETAEHRLQVAGRTADDLKDIRGPGLLLKRFAKVGDSLAQFIEQSRVLDGDDSLSGKILD
jgi:hypothetical protein